MYVAKHHRLFHTVELQGTRPMNKAGKGLFPTIGKDNAAWSVSPGKLTAAGRCYEGKVF